MEIPSGDIFYLASLFAGILTDELYFITLVLMPPLVRPSQVNWQVVETLHTMSLPDRMVVILELSIILRLLLQQLRLQHPQSHNLPEQR